MFDSQSLTHAQQQEAVDAINKLMEEGISSSEAIQKIAQQIRDGKFKWKHDSMNLNTINGK